VTADAGDKGRDPKYLFVDFDKAAESHSGDTESISVLRNAYRAAREYLRSQRNMQEGFYMQAHEADERANGAARRALDFLEAITSLGGYVPYSDTDPLATPAETDQA